MELDRISEEKKREERVGLREWKGSSESRVLWGELPECCPAYNKNKHKNERGKKYIPKCNEKMCKT